MDSGRLKEDGFHLAAEALVHQTMLRQLPRHDRDTLLVYATARKGTLSECLKTSNNGVISAPGQDSFLAGRDTQTGHLGASNNGAIGVCHGVSDSRGAQFQPAYTAFNMQSIESVPHPTDVSTIPGTAYKKELQRILRSRYQGPSHGRSGTPEAKAHQALRAQDPATMSSFVVQGIASSELLPGGIPILDHAIASLSLQPAWTKTTNVLKSFSKLRITPPQALPEIRELVIGVSSTAEFDEAGQWITRKQEETKEMYGFCLPALDVEKIGLILDHCDPNWESIQTRFLLDEKLSAVIQVHGKDNASRYNFPVLLMYGGVGWQLHLRILVNYRQNSQAKSADIPAMEVDRDPLSELFKRFLPAVGTGIREDITEFFHAVNAVASLDLSHSLIPVGVSLDKLAKLCGISHTQSSLVSMVYLVLGGVLAKDWQCSVADHKWGMPLHKLDNGLKAYLAGDIQQVAVSASVLAIVWVNHVLPDGQYISEMVDADPLHFVGTWMDIVTQWENSWCTTVGSRTPLATTRKELLAGIGIAPNCEPSLTSFCPDWPAITSGGPANLNGTREFSSKVINFLRTFYSAQLSGLQRLPASPAVVPATSGKRALPAPQPPAKRRVAMPSPRVDPEKQLVCSCCPFKCWSVGELKAHMDSCGNESVGAEPVDAAKGREMMGNISRHPAAQASNDPYFDLLPEDLSSQDLIRLAKELGVFQKQVVAEYVLRDLDRAVRLLAFLEQDKRFGIKAFGFFLASGVVGALRIHLHGQNRLRERDPQWRDIWVTRKATEEGRDEYRGFLQKLQQSAQDRLDRVNIQVEQSAHLFTVPVEELVRPIEAPKVAPFKQGMSCGARRRRRKAAAKALALGGEGLNRPDEEKHQRVVRVVGSSPLKPSSFDQQCLGKEGGMAVLDSSPPRRVLEQGRTPAHPNSESSKRDDRRRDHSGARGRGKHLPNVERSRPSVFERLGGCLPRHRSVSGRRREVSAERQPMPTAPAAAIDLPPSPSYFEFMDGGSDGPREGVAPQPLPADPPQQIAPAMGIDPFSTPASLPVPVPWDDPLLVDPNAQPSSSFPVMTEEMKEQVRLSKTGPEKEIVVRRQGVQVTRGDLRSLNNGIWLNDAVISASLTMMEERSQQPGAGIPTVCVVDSLWVQRLMEKGYDPPQHRRCNPFDSQLLLWPINVGKVHWALAVANHKLKTIDYFDSLGECDSRAVESLQEFIKGEHEDIYGAPIERYAFQRKTAIPGQVGGKDCGVFLLAYADFLTRCAPFTFSQADVEYLRQKIAWEIINGRFLA